MADEKATTETMPEWLEKKRYCEARVNLGGNDHVIIVAALRGELLSKVNEIRTLVLDLIPEAGETGEALKGWAEVRALVEESLTPERVENLIKLLDEVLARCVRSWLLTEMQAVYGWEAPPKAPGDCENAAERAAAFDLLPIPVLRRIIHGVGWLSGNS